MSEVSKINGYDLKDGTAREGLNAIIKKITITNTADIPKLSTNEVNLRCEIPEGYTLLDVRTINQSGVIDVRTTKIYTSEELGNIISAYVVCYNTNANTDYTALEIGLDFIFIKTEFLG